MRHLLLRWPARLSGCLATLVGLVGLGSITDTCQPASSADLARSGGDTGTLRVTTKYSQAVCNTGICYDAGGHSFVCEDAGDIGTLGTGQLYTAPQNVRCSPLVGYTFTGCVGKTFSLAQCDNNKTEYPDP